MIQNNYLKMLCEKIQKTLHDACVLLDFRQAIFIISNYPLNMMHRKTFSSSQWNHLGVQESSDLTRWVGLRLTSVLKSSRSSPLTRSTRKRLTQPELSIHSCQWNDTKPSLTETTSTFPAQDDIRGLWDFKTCGLWKHALT